MLRYYAIACDCHRFYLEFMVLIAAHPAYGVECLYMDQQELNKRYREFRRHHLLWPALLVLAGVGFLLENFNILPVQTVGRFWPLLLIIWGLDMIWRRTQEHSPRA